MLEHMFKKEIFLKKWIESLDELVDFINKERLAFFKFVNEKEGIVIVDLRKED